MGSTKLRENADSEYILNPLYKMKQKAKAEHEMQ
jgi:hypothetical protein